MSFVAYLNYNLERLDRGASYLSALAILAVMILTVANVVGRYFFHLPLISYIDLMQLLMAALVYLSLSYSHLTNGQIRFDLLMDKWGNIFGRKIYIEGFHLVLALFLCLFLSVSAVNAAWAAWVINEVTLTLPLPVWPAKVAVALGWIALALRILMNLILICHPGFNELNQTPDKNSI